MNNSIPSSFRRRGNILLAILLVGLGVGGWMLLHRAHETGVHDHDGEAAVLSLNNGQRWETDLPLRTGMQRIREAVDQTALTRGSRPLTPAEANALSASVQENVTYLIENCKLPPEADANLHVLITELLTGAARLASNPAAGDGIEQITRALRHYPVYFNHPGWAPLDAAH